MSYTSYSFEGFNFWKLCNFSLKFHGPEIFTSTFGQKTWFFLWEISTSTFPIPIPGYSYGFNQEISRDNCNSNVKRTIEFLLHEIFFLYKSRKKYIIMKIIKIIDCLCIYVIYNFITLNPFVTNPEVAINML